VLLHVHYMFRNVLRPSTGMSIQNLINKDTTVSKGLLVYSHYFIMMIKNKYKHIKYKV